MYDTYVLTKCIHLAKVRQSNMHKQINLSLQIHILYRAAVKGGKYCKELSSLVPWQLTHISTQKSFANVVTYRD